MESVKQCQKKFQLWKGFKEKKVQKWKFEIKLEDARVIGCKPFKDGGILIP